MGQTKYSLEMKLSRSPDMQIKPMFYDFKVLKIFSKKSIKIYKINTRRNDKN
jgi:hypothetical protein